MAVLRDRYGAWALITGAETAIGQEFARQIASQGVNLVLTAPSDSDLASFLSELEGAHDVEVRVLSVDPARPGLPPALRRATRDIEVGTLVNIAGTWFPGGFVENDLGDDETIVELNLEASIVMAQHFGQRMAERGRGGMLLVSSPVLARPAPFAGEGDMVVPAELPIVETLWYELSPHGVDVLGMTVDPDPNATSADALRHMVAEALGKLGEATSKVPGRMNTPMNLMGTWIFSRDVENRVKGALTDKAARAILN